MNQFIGKKMYSIMSQAIGQSVHSLLVEMGK